LLWRFPHRENSSFFCQMSPHSSVDLISACFSNRRYKNPSSSLQALNSRKFWTSSWPICWARKHRVNQANSMLRYINVAMLRRSRVFIHSPPSCMVLHSRPIIFPRITLSTNMILLRTLFAWISLTSCNSSLNGTSLLALLMAMLHTPQPFHRSDLLPIWFRLAMAWSVMRTESRDGPYLSRCFPCNLQICWPTQSHSWPYN
jgi:hypothetical protein